MHKDHFKNTSYELIAGIAKAIGNAHRLEILELLANGSKSVEALAKEARLSIANASQHLQILKKHKLVEIRRSGTTIHYSLPDKSIIEIMRNLHLTAKNQLPELANIINDYRKEQGIQEYTINHLPDEDHILLDIRPAKEYWNGHKDGAINVQIDKLEKAIPHLQKDKLIITYCRGELCTYADDAVRILREEGFNAFRLNEPIMMISA